jgi:hypothetical protein
MATAKVSERQSTTSSTNGGRLGVARPRLDLHHVGTEVREETPGGRAEIRRSTRTWRADRSTWRTS